MDYYLAKENLIKLLCCSIETLNDDELRKLVKKRYKLWHPDKNKENPEKYKENFITLNESYRVYRQYHEESSSTKDSGNYSENLFCDEDMDTNWESDDSDYNSTPFDDDFFNASPKKNFAVPEPLRLFFRAKTNRRAGKLFMLFTFADPIHQSCLEKLSKDNLIKSLQIFAARTNKEIFCTIVLSHVEQRLVDIKKLSKRYGIMSAEIFYAVTMLKLYEKLLELYGNPVYQWGEKIERKTTTENSFNNKQLVEFAITYMIEDVYDLMYEYAHLADPCDRPGLTKEHEDDHINEILNAKKFVHLPDRQRVCKNAVNCVKAKLKSQLKTLSNIHWLEMRSREFSERLSEIDDPKVFGHAFWYYKYVIGEDMFKDVLSFIISVFTDSNIKHKKNDGKKRYLILRGLYNCGKTTFANAIMDFFEGLLINVNVCKDRLPFYLGSAIGKRFVLFDDVKGYKPLMEGLEPGTGLSNLDDCREHLDGMIAVQLEKKNQNPVHQIFPQGIITMNRYQLPGSLKIRCHIVDFPPSVTYKKHRYRITMDIIYIAMAMLNLVPCDPSFISHCYKKRDQWKKAHMLECTCLAVSVFSYNGGCCKWWFIVFIRIYGIN